MKKIFLNFLFVVIMIFNIDRSYSAVQDKIIANVQNEIITAYDMENEIRTLLVLSGQEISQKNIDKTKKIALNNLINLKLKEIETSRFNIKLNDKAVDEYLIRLTSNNVSSLKKKFEINNLNYDHYLYKIENELKWQSLIFSKYSKNVKIRDEDVDKDLKEILSGEINLKDFKLSEIEIILNDENIENIDEIKKVVLSSNFKEAAKKLQTMYSEINYNELGWINGKVLSKNIYEIVKNLKIGETSKPIKNQNNVLFLKLDDKRSPQIEANNIENIKENLKNQKKNELFALYSSSYLSQIKNNYLIQLK